MKHVGRAIEHEGRQYYLLEDGYNDATRAVVFLCRPDDRRFPFEKPPASVALPGRGAWRAVARWSGGGLTFADPGHREHGPMIEERVADYLADAARPDPVAFAVEREGAFLGSVAAAVPMGIAVHCWDDEDEAARAAREAGGDARVVPVDDRARFLNQMVRQGYAGALWNERLPVFFCIDEAGALRYLRLSPGGRQRLSMEILDRDDRWEGYEGAEEISFLDNAEACDERLVATLGRRPPLDWPDDGRLLSVGPADGTPAIVTDETFVVPSAVLFSDAAAAEEFREDRDPDWVVFPVDDARAFLRQPVLAGAVAQLNPGGHRARGGTLWLAGDEAVLDAFSGFWRLDDAGLQPMDEASGDERG